MQKGGQVVMFTGSYEHSVDAKGRLIIPSRFRDELGERFIVTLGLDGCLFLYSEERWEAFMTELMNMPGTADTRKLQRYFMAYASECEPDKQGRVLIPQKLRAKVGIQTDVVLVGVITKIEVWAKETWEKNDDYDGMEDIAEHLAQYNLKF